jgi:hypothetical protein
MNSERLLASLAYLRENVFDFSGKARKIKHIPPFCERSEQNLVANLTGLFFKRYLGLYFFARFARKKAFIKRLT